MTFDELKSRTTLITARQNAQVIRAAGLRIKKYRDAEGVFLADGYKLVGEAISSGLDVRKIYLSENGVAHCPECLIKLISEKYVSKTLLLSDECYEKITDEKAPQGITGEFAMPVYWSRYTDNYECDIEASEGVLMLENIQDPGNMGTILRSAAAFGIDRTVLIGDCADVAGSKALRASMGAAFKMKIDTVKNGKNALEQIKGRGRRILSTELNRDSALLSDIALSKSDVFLIGNEGSGVTKEISERCDGSVYIPMSGKTESLNASIAASICLWQRFIAEK